MHALTSGNVCLSAQSLFCSCCVSPSTDPLVSIRALSPGVVLRGCLKCVCEGGGGCLGRPHGNVGPEGGQVGRCLKFVCEGGTDGSGQLAHS